MTTALLIIDIQNDYFPGGAMELCGAEEAGRAAASLLTLFRGAGLPVLHVQHNSVRPEAGFLLPGTSGAEIHHLVTPREGEAVVLKNFPNSFRGTVLQQLLKDRGVDRLVVCGMMTHMCVDTTVRAGFDLGYRIILAHDGCATRALSFGERETPAELVQGAYMAALGAVFARVAASSEIAGLL